MLKKFCTLIAVIACVIGIAGCAWGGVSLSAFPDPTFREYLKQYDTGWGERDSEGNWHTVGRDDGILGDKEIERITDIGVQQYGIKSLKGIEHLTALTCLQCEYNQLTELDVSRNTALTWLECYNNQLTALNVSGCTALRRLYCGYNQLTALDVSGCTALTELSCSYNQLTALNVSGCTALTELSCDDNQLTALDVSGCTALTELGCYENQLTALNVSKNTALGILYCYNNQLTSLDVSKNTALTWLNCEHNQLTALNVSGCTALTSLHCDNNQLTALNVSGCTALRRLYCGGNQLTALDVSNNTALTGLYCGGNQLTELDLSKNTALTNLECWGQKRSGLKVKKTSEGYYEVNMKDYVSHPENIAADSISADSISPQPVSYNKTTGIITFSEPITELSYRYITHSPYNDLMGVTITNPLSIVALERKGSETYGIICDMTENSYLNSNGNPLDESAIRWYSYSDYGKLGLAADGNSRLILRVQTDKPGTVSFSFNEEIGAKLESLSRKELSASDQLNTTEFTENLHQVSAVLVAPESFPKDKNFPSDTFKVHVKFTDEDGKVTEDDLELKIVAAPVVLIHGFGEKAKASNTFVDKGNGIMPILKKAGFTVYTWDYDGRQGPSVLLAGNDNKLSEKIEKIFDDYNKNKITCTRVDLVGYSMGGLMTRQFCLSEANKKSVSYCQGMVRRVITVATPHRGSPWSEVYYKYSDLANNVMRLIVGECFTAWQDMLPGSAVTTANFPANIPMYSIYGMANDSLDALIAEYRTALMRLTPAIRVNYSGHSLLSRVSYLKWRTILILTYVRDMFHGEENDWCVSESSAQGDFSGHSSGFQHSSDFNHINICKQNVIGAEIGSLLMGDSSKFKIFGSSSSSANAVTRVADSSASTTEYSIETPFRIKVAPEVLNVNETGEAKITVISNIAINSNLYMAISNGDTESIFSVASKDAKTFELSITFTSQDTGIMEISCFSYNTNGDKTRFYVSDTARITLLKKLDSVKITSIDFTGGSTVYTNVNSETHAGLYAVDENGKYYDVSSPLAGTQWTSTKIARVNDNGCIVGLKEGKTTLTATFRGFTASVNVEVSEAIEEEPTSYPTPPEITVSALPGGAKGTPYSFQLKASGTTPITWSLKSGKMPAGLKLDSSGLISGTPTKAGKFTLTFKAVNSTNKTDTAKLTLQVFDPVSITTASLKAGTIGKSYSVTLKAKGTKPITWSAEGLPNGLTINAKTGRISGKPTEYGDNFSVNVTASNGAGSVTRTLSLTVKAIPPTLSGSLKKPTLNVYYSSGLKLSKGTVPIEWSISGTLPTGLKFDTKTGIISGTPTSYAKSGYKITITAENSAGKKSKRITLKVNGKAPVIKATLPKTATYGQTYSATLKATGSTPITFTVDRLPYGLSLNDGVISGIVTETTKSFKFTVYAENPVKKVKKSFTIKINNIPKSAKETPPENTDNESDSETPSDNNAVEPNVTDNTETQTGTQTQGTQSQTQNQKSGVPEGYIVVAELGTVSRDEAGMYDFDVTLSDDVPAGAELMYVANSDRPSDDDEIAEFFDSTGNEITAVPKNRKISVSIWLNPDTIYHPAIAVKQ